MKATNQDWLDALDKLQDDKRLAPHLAEILADLEIDLAALEGRLDEPGSLAFDALFGESEWGPQTPGQWLLGAMLARRTRSFVKKSEKITGNLVVTERRVVEGDLEISGNLEAKNDLFVLGDLTVGGYFRDTCRDISNIIIAGDLKVGSMLFTEGFLMVGGRASAPVVALSFNQGFTKVLAGVAAKAIIEADHGGSRIFGPVDAGVLIYDELVTDDDDRDNGEVADLAALLAADARDGIADLDPMDAASKLIELVVAGRAIFAK